MEYPADPPSTGSAVGGELVIPDSVRLDYNNQVMARIRDINSTSHALSRGSTGDTNIPTKSVAWE